MPYTDYMHVFLVLGYRKNQEHQVGPFEQQTEKHPTDKVLRQQIDISFVDANQFYIEFAKEFKVPARKQSRP